jgi:hypothetical protein
MSVPLWSDTAEVRLMVMHEVVHTIVNLLRQDSNLSHQLLYVIGFSRGFVAGQGLKIDPELVAASVLRALGSPPGP